MNKVIYNTFRNIIIYLFIQSSLGFYKILLNIKKKLKTRENQSIIIIIIIPLLVSSCNIQNNSRYAGIIDNLYQFWSFVVSTRRNDKSAFLLKIKTK